MDRISAKKACAFDKVFGSTVTHHDCAQLQPADVRRASKQDACDQTPDSAEPIEHNISAFTSVDVSATSDTGEFCCDEFVKRYFPRRQECSTESCNVDGGRTRVQRSGRSDEFGREIDAQFFSIDMPGKSVDSNDVNGRQVEQTAPMNRQDNTVLSVQAPDEWDEFLGDGDFVRPVVGLSILGAGVRHGKTFLCAVMYSLYRAGIRRLIACASSKEFHSLGA
jgi:hypothetical protein